MPLRKNILTVILAVLVFFVGLWKLEQTNRFKFLFQSREDTKIEQRTKALALKKRRIYESNPNLDFDLLRVTSGHASRSSGISHDFGYRNIIGPERR